MACWLNCHAVITVLVCPIDEIKLQSPHQSACAKDHQLVIWLFHKCYEPSWPCLAFSFLSRRIMITERSFQYIKSFWVQGQRFCFHPYVWNENTNAPELSRSKLRLFLWKLNAGIAIGYHSFVTYQCIKLHMLRKAGIAMKIYMQFNVFLYLLPILFQLTIIFGLVELPRFVRGSLKFGDAMKGKRSGILGKSIRFSICNWGLLFRKYQARGRVETDEILWDFHCHIPLCNLGRWGGFHTTCLPVPHITGAASIGFGAACKGSWVDDKIGEHGLLDVLCLWICRKYPLVRFSCISLLLHGVGDPWGTRVLLLSSTVSLVCR